LIGHPSLEEPELNEREQQRDAEQRDGEYCRLAVVLGELELVVDEVRQHVGRLQRPAPGGEQVDLPEGLEAEDRAHDDGEEDRGRQERQRHVPETRPGTGAIDLGRLLYVVRDRLEPGRHQDEAQSEVLPDRRDRHGDQRDGRYEASDHRQVDVDDRTGILEDRRFRLDALQQPALRAQQRAEDHGCHRHRRRDGGREERPVDPDGLQLLVREDGEQDAQRDPDRHGDDREGHRHFQAVEEVGRRQHVPVLVDPYVVLRLPGKRRRREEPQVEVADEGIEDEDPEDGERRDDEQVAEAGLASSPAEPAFARGRRGHGRLARTELHRRVGRRAHASTRSSVAASKTWRRSASGVRPTALSMAGAGTWAAWRTMTSWPSSSRQITWRSCPNDSITETVALTGPPSPSCKSSGRAPTTTCGDPSRSTAPASGGGNPTTPPGMRTARPPSTRVTSPEIVFIGGFPMKRATKRFAGRA